MESDIYPTIRFQLDSVETVWERGDSAEVVLNGRFTIHGVTRPERFNAQVHRGTDGIRVTARIPMNVKDYKVGGLSKFLGTLKMHPEIVVRVDVTFGGYGTTLTRPSRETTTLRVAPPRASTCV